MVGGLNTLEVELAFSGNSDEPYSGLSEIELALMRIDQNN